MTAPTLTVRAIKATPVSVPLKRPVAAATGSIPAAPLVLVDLETEEGVTGRSYVVAYSNVTLGPLAGIVNGMTEWLAGDPVSPYEIEAKLRKRLLLVGTTGLTGIGLAAVDMCAWDAAAKAVGLPLVQFLGGQVKAVPAYNSCGLWMMPIAKLADEAEALLAEGQYRAIKLRTGRDTLADDLAAVRSVKIRIGDDVKLMTDFNQKLTVNEAISRGRALDNEGLYWIEEPVRHDDYQGCARVSAELRTPVQFGENLSNIYEMRNALAAHAADYVMPDVQRIGGVTGWLRAAAMAHAYGIEMSSHLFPEYSVHLLAVTPTCHYLEYMDWAAPILAEPLDVRDGLAIVPNRPGAGIEWDRDAVRRYALE
jgi:mandelate racemase